MHKKKRQSKTKKKTAWLFIVLFTVVGIFFYYSGLQSNTFQGLAASISELVPDAPNDIAKNSLKEIDTTSASDKTLDYENQYSDKESSFVDFMRPEENKSIFDPLEEKAELTYEFLKQESIKRVEKGKKQATEDLIRVINNFSDEVKAKICAELCK